MYKQFVCLEKTELPEDFIKLTTIPFGIDHQQMEMDKPLYLSIDNETKKGRFSDV